MNRTVEVATAATAMVALTSCGFFGGQENQTSPNNSDLEQLFAHTQEYWVGQGLGVVASTELVTLREPSDKFYCNYSEDTPDRAAQNVLRGDEYSVIAEYCPGENTIVVVEKAYTAAAEDVAKVDGVSSQTFGSYIMGHELGHRVTWAKGGVPPSQRLSELRADCAAGSAMTGMGATEVPALAQSSMLKGGTNETLTGDERVVAFNEGIADPSGESCVFYYPASDLSSAAPAQKQ